MARLKVKLDHRGMADLLRDAGLAADLLKRAERVKAKAAATAPHATGEFAGSFTARAVVTPGTRGRPSVVGRVYSSDPHGLSKEAQFRTMSRAMDAAG